MYGRKTRSTQIQRTIKTNSWPLFNRKTTVQTLGDSIPRSNPNCLFHFSLSASPFVGRRLAARDNRQPGVRQTGAIEPLVWR